ncbi:MAG: imidazole glycerol phosphate synthase subunit HisH [Deltaproteobacteria bacterium]|nr:imidazole glycerol phosphate synthase subunit HisH [Deltaproteobacteria bacterium]
MIENPKVAIVDFGLGNLFSIKLACEASGLTPKITSDPYETTGADALILPGVGAFGDAMESLERLGLISAIMEFAASGKPLLGICLGMQLLMSESEEFGSHKGLGIISGPVVRFRDIGNKKIKVPQVGWNRIFKTDSGGWDSSSLKGIGDGTYMYFVHSYYAVPSLSEAVLCETDYEGHRYCSGISWRNISAFQFHPEKSSKMGVMIYRNWAETVINNKRSMV